MHPCSAALILIFLATFTFTANPYPTKALLSQPSPSQKFIPFDIFQSIKICNYCYLILITANPIIPFVFSCSSRHDAGIQGWPLILYTY
uniref:Secreted protein n=1 Tax=Salix viminalis TaxID=40686 RepID=A0A6N2JYC4_SALVM